MAKIIADYFDKNPDFCGQAGGMFGAAHIPGIIRHLTQRYGFRFSGSEWITYSGHEFALKVDVPWQKIGGFAAEPVVQPIYGELPDLGNIRVTWGDFNNPSM